MGVYNPIWKTNDKKQFDKAMRAAKRTTDQKNLKEIALHAYFKEVRLEALERITDREILKDLGITFDTFLSQAVIARVDDEELLKEIAVEGCSDFPTREAVRKITRTDLLIDIVCSNARESVVEQAMERINDPWVLEEAFFNTYRDGVRSAIWKKLPFDVAKDIVDKTCESAREICEDMGAHCDAPGPKLHFVEVDQETGSREHELICCKLCGKPMWSRSKACAEWGSWEGGTIDLRQWKNWKLQDGIWQAKDRKNACLRVMTQDYEGCRTQ